MTTLGNRDQSSEELLTKLYQELRELAAAKMAREPSGQTIQATALVHEAYVRIVKSGRSDDPEWEGRGHFFAAAAEADAPHPCRSSAGEETTETRRGGVQGSDRSHGHGSASTR